MKFHLYVFAYLPIALTLVQGSPLEFSDLKDRLAERKACPKLTNAISAPVVAGGYSASLAANNLNNPRQIIFDKQGRLLVVDRGVGVKRFTVDSCGLLTKSATIISDPKLNHGLTMTPDGKTLFASDVDAAYAWSYDPSKGTVSNKKTLVTGMTSGGHTTRSLLLPATRPDLLLISVGSIGNFDMGTSDYNSGRSQIRGFYWKNLLSKPVVYRQSGINFGWGLRNSVGLRDDGKGQLWSVENSADNVVRNGVDVHNNNPAEELNFHGSLKSTSPRGNYGYPSCLAVWNPSVLPNRGSLKTGDQFTLNTNSDFTDARCKSNYQPPRLSFPAHTAPLDILFDKQGDAWVSLHGSWNRDTPQGYKLIRIQFNSSTSQPTASNSSTTGFQTILSNRDITKCPDGCFRPTSLALGKDGLYMSSDSTGQIYRIANTGSR